MDAQFWINAWNEGRTNFHKSEYHEKLLEIFPSFKPEVGQKVLVPLCGKSKDLLWLKEQKLSVHGIELYDQAVEAFFRENNLPVEKHANKNFMDYHYQNLTISCGDFFKFNQKQSYDFIYDRASLVALPPDMRKTYAQILKDSLKPGGKYLLIAYEYDQSKLQGPPFSVDRKEIFELYQDHFKIEQIEAKQTLNEGQRLATVESLRQTVYILS